MSSRKGKKMQAPRDSLQQLEEEEDESLGAVADSDGDADDDDDDEPEAPASSKAPAMLANAASPSSNSEKENGKGATPKSASSATGIAAPASGGSSSAAKHPGSSKSYVEMVHDAITALKDRTGSSQPAICKWIQQSVYKPRMEKPNFKRLLNQALKSGVSSGRFTKVKSSFKIAMTWKEAERKKLRMKKARAAAALAAAKRNKIAEEAKKRPVTLSEFKEFHEKKLEELEQKLSPEELEKERQKMLQREEAARLKEEADRKQKERADRLRKRRFPMEDTKLHAEDKELQVRPPADVVNRPYLPFFWNLTRPLSDPSRAGKTSHATLQNSKVESLDYAGSNGFVPDLLQVYHFFRGDVHFTIDSDDNPMVPDFTLQNLVFSADQVVSGLAKANRMVPPLLVHLFCCCLSILCQPPTDNTDNINNNNNNKVADSRRRLSLDLHKYLAPVLTPASWADVCFLYMDAMERFFATDASRDPAVLHPLVIDLPYLFARQDQPELPMTPAVVATATANGATAAIVNGNKKTGATAGGDVGGGVNTVGAEDGYCAYLGDSRSVLYRAHYKLLRQDPWLLTAEELFALLRALTDDILASHPAVGQDIGDREEEMQELLKGKRSADMKFRKVRLAFEGPKKPAVKKPSTTAEDDNATKETEKSTGAENGKEENKEEEPFKPTATKKQFEAAKKMQQKANDAYEKGIRKLVARTEPVGYDRNFNAVYCFRHDPEVLYVEELRQPSAVAAHLPLDMQFARRSWHVIENTSLFDTFTSSLDIRGKREHDLYEELLGPSGAQQSLRRYLYDDVKDEAAANAQLKEKEALKKRLEIARVKCDEEKGRRSGRLASQAELELIQVENEIQELERRIEGQQVEEDVRDFESLAGLDLLRKFDSIGRMETRKSREKKDTSNNYSMQCSKLVSSGNIDGTGIAGMLVADVLGLEERCEALAPWEKKVRATWIAQLEGAVNAWNSATAPANGSPGTPFNNANAASSSTSGPTPTSRQLQRDSLDSVASNASKRRRFESPAQATPQGPHSVSSVLSMLKQPLLDLEERIADMTNVSVATRDADIADDNMSTDSSQEDQANKARLERAWKKIVNSIRSTPTKKHVQIRELVVSAISAARKAHLPEIVAQLRAALLQYHPNAAGDCKAAAIEVLESNGDYDEEEDDMESDDEEDANDEPEPEELPSVVCAEAAIIRSSLGGSDDGNRADWIDAVKSSKTISRLASLSAGFVQDAMEKIHKIEIERADLLDALGRWEKESKAKKSGGKEFVGASEVWANARITDEICMAYVEGYPWWPAKKCEIAKDPAVAVSLSAVNRCLVSLVGEMGGLRVVKVDDLKPFTGKAVEEDLADLPKNMRNQLEECMAMARRILRGCKK